MKTLDRAAQLDNVMFTNYPLRCRGDVEKAFDGSGMIIDASCRVQYIDNGALATFRAGEDGGEMEPWMAIDWTAFEETDRNTWLVRWAKLPQAKTAQ